MEAQGQELEQRGALHLFEVEWKQLRALLTPISAQESFQLPGNVGPTSPGSAFPSKATQQEDDSLLELSFTAQRHLPAQPGLSAASGLA